MPEIILSLGGGEALAVRRVSVREAVSSLFEVKVVAASPDPALDLGAIVGGPAALRIAATAADGDLHGERTWAGMCPEARQRHALDLQDGEGGASTYEITIAPALWRLTRRTDYRVFQHLSGYEIVQALLDEWGVEATWAVDALDHPRLPYRVQYGESDFSFCSRLLEEAGIAYAFLDDGDVSQLAFSDALQVSAPRRAAPITYLDNPIGRFGSPYVTRVEIAQHLRTEAVAIQDHDFQRPSWPLLGRARVAASRDARSEHAAYRPGACAVEEGNGLSSVSPNDKYAAGLARRALEAERSGERTISFDTNALDLSPGTVIEIDGHPRPDIDRGEGFLVTSLSLAGGPRGVFTIHGTAVPAAAAYRPPQRTPKPRAYGVQSATVVGPRGQEIHTDELGRVRVQFHWDRRGERNDKSSHWLRVSQGAAGAGTGLFSLPRVGEEVLVAFLDGDPDQPVVIGRVSNAVNPVPLKLPEEKAQSVWRSSSSPGSYGFNELRFENSRGHERVALRAERDLRTQIGNDETLAVRRHRIKAVGGDESARIEGRAIAYVGRDAHLTVEEELRERVGGTRSLIVDGDRQEWTGGAMALAADGAIHLQAGTSLVIEAADITLRGPGGFVRIDAGGVSTAGGAGAIKAGGAPGAGAGAHPAMPLLPNGLALRTEPVRLPLLGFATGLPPLQAGGGDGPRTPEETVLCGLICRCKDEGKQACVTRNLRAMEDASGHSTTIKSEVPYDMSKRPPQPIMSRSDPRRATRRWPKGSKIPDVVIVKDGTKPPTRDNLKEVIEIKFPPDKLDRAQRNAYRKIAGPVPFRELGPDNCGCPAKKKQTASQKVTAGDIAEVAALTLFVIAAVLDDAVPGGQVDDVAIPPAIVRILGRLAPLVH